MYFLGGSLNSGSGQSLTSIAQESTLLPVTFCFAVLIFTVLFEVIKVTQRDQIVGHNMSDSPEQCSGEQTILL